MAAHRGTIELYQGNETVRRLTAAALGRAGFRVVERTCVDDAPGDIADLLLLDVSSGLAEVDSRATVYAESAKPVLYSGVRGDRQMYADLPWLDRPFARNSLVAACLRIVEGVSFVSLGSEDDPVTREMQYEEALNLERQLGLEPGLLVPDMPDVEIEENDDDEDIMSLDEHGSAIIGIEDLSSLVSGGKLIGGVTKRAVDAYEIINDRVEPSPLYVMRTPTFNQTMPDTPMALAADEIDTATQNSPSIVPPPDDTSSTHPELSVPLRTVARMLAESWNRIGVSARSEDRAGHIERVLNAMLQQGVRGAKSELRRIPPGEGFSGTLDVLSVIDLLRTVRDRRLRGRLELSLYEGAFVMYLEGGFIEDVEALSGVGDLRLLDSLRAMGYLSEVVHAELSQGYATGAYLEPAELKIRRDGLVAEHELREGRVQRLRDTFRFLCASRKGDFAFMVVQPGDGLPWPMRGLHLPVDTLLLEILREGSVDTGDSQATARTRLVIDTARTSALAPTLLSDEEVAVLRYFRDGETVGNVLEQLTGAEVDKIVQRLKSLELLRRTHPEIGIKTPREPVQTFETVVSLVPDSISRHERTSQSSKRDDQTTHLKESFSIGPDLESEDDDQDDETDIV